MASKGTPRCGPARRVRTLGQIYVSVIAVSSITSEPEADELTRAVVETARYAACQKWGRPPQLFSLARKEALTSLGEDLPVGARDAPAGSLIPIEQDLLLEGEPATVIASVHWPQEVEGCVLVTEITVVLPPDAGEQRDESRAIRRAGVTAG